MSPENRPLERIHQHSRETIDHLQRFQTHLMNLADHNRALHPQWAKLEGIASIKYTKGDSERVIAESDIKERKIIESEGYNYDRRYTQGQYAFSPVEVIIIKALHLTPKDFEDPIKKDVGYTCALATIAGAEDEVVVHPRIQSALESGLHSIFRMEYLIKAYFNEEKEYSELANTITTFRQSLELVGWKIGLPLTLLHTTCQGRHIKIGDNLPLRSYPYIGVESALRYIPLVHQIVNARAEEVKEIDTENREKSGKSGGEINKSPLLFFVDLLNSQVVSPENYKSIRVAAWLMEYQIGDWGMISPTFSTIY